MISKAAQRFHTYPNSSPLRPAEGKAEQHIRNLAPLAFVSPRIITAIMAGAAPAGLTVTALAAGLQPEVREAAVRWDRATPSTHRDLVRARLATQARGIPAAERAPLYSGEVEDFLVPVMIRMGRGEEGAVVVELRKAPMRLYGEFGETVLTFMLKTYRHHSTEALLGAARATAP